MLKHKDNTIEKMVKANASLVKLIYNGVTVYYAVKASGKVEPCFAVVDDITTYTDTTYKDVYDKATACWYKLNNLLQYEKYGVYENVTDLDTATYYTGKLVIYNSHEYKRTTSGWTDLGELQKEEDIVFVHASSGYVRFGTSLTSYWNNGYHIYMDMYRNGSINSWVSSFGPFEIRWPSGYSNFYFDWHSPTSTTSPTVSTADYDIRYWVSTPSNKTRFILDFYAAGYKVTSYDGSTTYYSGGTTNTYNWCTTEGYNFYLYVPQNSWLHEYKIVDNNGNAVHDYIAKSDDTGIYFYDKVTNEKYTCDYYSSSGATLSTEVIEGEYKKIIEEYDTKVPPANNVTYDTLEELELMECPWIGMHAYVGDDYYTYTEDGWTKTERILPDGYTQVEYIYNPSTAYINTGVYPDNNFEYDITCMFTTTTQTNGYYEWHSIFGGTYTSSGVGRSFGTPWNGNWDYYIGSHVNMMDQNQTVVSTNKVLHSLNESLHLVLKDNTLYVNDTVEREFTPNGSPTSTLAFELFSAPIEGTYTYQSYTQLRIYSCKLYEDDVMVRNMVPCTNSSGTAGMYDTVNNKFYGSATSTALTAGPEV